MFFFRCIHNHKKIIISAVTERGNKTFPFQKGTSFGISFANL